ncbi:hypothetical protein ASZ90_003520 [hydrocarbon metagenome]|uniref:DNA-directed RNA polymerase n=1 Tax=hydrocarbon metagenome TaxID=938273 RepID=A0A0W8G0J5_9ZZZZ
MPIRPIELRKLENKTANVYEAVIVAAKKARMINDQTKLEFTTLLNTMIPNVDDEFEEKENPDQLRLSLEFENRNKPHLQALEELIDGKIEFRFKEDQV